MLDHARQLLEAEDHEGAVRVYQDLGMWKEAGEARRAGRRQVVTQVHVNVNDLIEQLRNMGLTANYTCSVCHGPYTITGETKPDALSKCAYCGAVIRPTELVDTVAKVVGYR